MKFEEVVQKAVKLKAKVGLRSSTMVWDLDIRCPRDHRFFNSTASKIQTQGIIAKDSHSEELKVKKVKSTLF